MIAIQDNDYNGKVCHLLKVSNLLSVANKPIRQLCEEDNNILVFPLSIDDADDTLLSTRFL